MKSFLIYFYLLLKVHFSENFKNTTLNKIQRKYETKYFLTELDHFSYHRDSTKLRLRYIISLQYWTPGNAILFYCGNEGSIEASSQRAGFIWELGQRLSAMVVFAEHRYYGKSVPFVNKSLSTQNFFAHLTSFQALADYASLVSDLKVSIVGAEKSAVIAFGGSYGGMLSAWFRQKYPHLIAGALASSAPVLMIDNVPGCGYPYEIVTNTYKSIGGITCTRNIRTLWTILQGMSSSRDLSYLTKTFGICESLKNTESLKTLISDILFETAVLNYPYPFTLFRSLPAWPVKAFCEGLFTEITNPRILLKTVFKSLQRVYNHSGHIKCLPLQSSESSDDIAWSLQTCMEIPMPMCSTGVKDMFYKNEYNKQAAEQQCEKQFKLKPQPRWMQTLFGDSNFKSESNIIFSNGLLDPWSAGGIYHSPSKSVSIIRIPYGAHCEDLRASHPHDLPDIRNARKLEEKIIVQWIKNWG